MESHDKEPEYIDIDNGYLTPHTEHYYESLQGRKPQFLLELFQLTLVIGDSPYYVCLDRQDKCEGVKFKSRHFKHLK